MGTQLLFSVFAAALLPCGSRQECDKSPFRGGLGAVAGSPGGPRSVVDQGAENRSSVPKDPIKTRAALGLPKILYANAVESGAVIHASDIMEIRNAFR